MLADLYNVVYWDQEDQPSINDGDGIAAGNVPQEDTEAVR